MRIGLLTTEYVTEKYFDGGLANYVHRIAKSLASLGHDVHVVTLSEIDKTDFNHEGVHVHRVMIGKLKWRLDRLTHYRLPYTTQCLDYSFEAYRKLRQLHQQKPLEIVQFPNWSSCGLFSSLFLRIPYVVRISSYEPVWNELLGVERDWDTSVTEWLEWFQLSLSRHTYAPSYTLQQILAQKARIHNVHVIRTPFYMETAKWDSSVYEEHLKDKKYLLFFGRFQPHKGFHILAQALPQVLERHPDCHAVFVGKDNPSSIAPSMTEYARSLSGANASRLTFIDRTPHSQLYPIIAGARLVVLPSLIDNLPNACLESMALGKPVIGTIGASFDELIVDGETGFLVSPNDVGALAKKINEVWEHPKLEEIGQAAKRKLLEFSPEHTIPEVLAYYKKILSKESRYSA